MDEKLADDALRRMIRLVGPEWDLREATPAERGFCSVYRVVVETPESRRVCFLKAAPSGRSSGVSADARISTVLREHTSVPVPEVIGVVDDHAELRSPFYLMEPMPGSDLPYEEVGRVPDDVLRTTAREVGAYLGELHRVDAVESYGYVDVDTSRRLSGGRPSGAAAELNVVDAHDSWRAYLGKRIEHELERHATSRFSDLTPRLESWCRKRVENLSDPFSPVLGRNDHGFHNLLVDPDTGEVTAMLDWAYTLAVTPAFDFEFGAYLFSGAFLSAIPEVPDRRESVRTAMLAGYRSTAPELLDAVSTRRPLYELLAMVRVMNDFDTLRPRLPEGTEDAVADGIGDDVESLFERAAR